MTFRKRVILTIGACISAAACHDTPAAPRPTPGHSVTVSFCAAEAPTWLAFQDGDGAWTRELPVADGSTIRFRHTFTNARGAIASFTPILDGDLTLLRVLYGAPDELATEGDTTDTECLTISRKTLHGSVAGLDATQSAFIAVGPEARTAVLPSFGLDYTIDGIQTGPQDLLAIRSAQSGTPRLILRRNIDLPDGALVPTLDFSSAEAFDAASANLVIDNLQGNAVVNFTVLTTAHGEFSLPIVSTSTYEVQPYFALPLDKLLPGEFEHVRLSANGATSTRTTDLYFRAPIDHETGLVEEIAAPTIGVIPGGQTMRLRAHYRPQTNYDALSSVVYEQPASNGFIVISMTPAYAAQTGAYDLDVPDLAGTPGFDPSWTLQPGVINWSAIRLGGTLPIGHDAKPFDGATRYTGLTQGTMQQP